METDLAAVSKTRRYAGWDSFYEEMGRPILEALRFAHERHIAHRDVKPRNILLDAAGNPKLADFGISKIKTWLVPELTLNQFASKPFSPPEYDDGSYTYSRDVFAFCVLSLQCLSTSLFGDYQDIQRSLDGLDLPAGIYDLFRQGIAEDPATRPQNASVLLALIESIQNERSALWVKRLPLHLHISDSALRKLFDEFPGRSRGEISALLAGDLSAACGFSTFHDERPGSSPRLSIYGASLECHVVLHRDNSAQFVVVAVHRLSMNLLEHRRERGLTRQVQVFFGLPENLDVAQETISTLLEDIREHECELKAQRDIQRENELFGRWFSILNLKADLEKAKEQPLQFTSIIVDESTAAIGLKAVPDEDILGQSRCVFHDERLLLKGDVESIEGNTVHLRVEFAASADLPSHGALVIDNAAAREALKRQRAALDDVRFDRAVRSDLRELLLSPEKSSTPVPVSDVQFVQGDLDEAKHQAVAKALGSPDFLLVQGPPGTGKTTFITETILQTLQRSPKARILLTSQTHVALDNAVERLQKHIGEFRIVRVGRAENPRISKSVEKLLIQNQIGEWRETVVLSGREYLERWAGSHGISRQHYDIATALRKISSCAEEDLELSEETKLVLTQLAELKSLLSTADKPDEVEAEIAQLRDQASTLRASRDVQQRERALAVADFKRLEPDATDILARPITELRDWADTYLPQTSASLQLQKLVETHSNWEVRLGRAADFESALIGSAQVIAGTCVGIAAARGLRDIEFDLCIIDEASKATPTETLVPMCGARSWIVVGDSRQLPPFIDDGAADAALLANYGLQEEMLSKTVFDRLEEHLPTECITTLDTQHRMVPQIGKLVSDCFYGGALKSAPKPWIDAFSSQLPRPVVWLTTCHVLHRSEARTGTSYSNTCEARIIYELLTRLDLIATQKRLKGWDVVILTSYGEQRHVIDREVAKLQLQSLRVECNTVDAVQGREAKVAIYSLTRSNSEKRLGFLKEKRRLNVALSRGQQYLVIVGDHIFARDAVGENPFAPVVNHIAQNRSDCVIKEFKR